MRILVTGAGGHLGRALVPDLRTRHDVVATDARPEPRVPGLRRLDVRQKTSLACGADCIIHLAALLPWNKATERDFVDVNLWGTLNVLNIAVQESVPRVVFASSTTVYGRRRLQRPEDLPINERTPVAPEGMYSLTKALGEQLCAHHSRVSGLTTLCLRCTYFGPYRGLRHGLRLLGGGADVRDVAHAFACAAESDRIESGAHEVFVIASAQPFRRADRSDLFRRAARAVERYYPGAAALLKEDGFELDSLAWYSIAKARRLLGYRPQHDFGAFLKNRVRARRR